jgi:hypothetical protein
MASSLRRSWDVVNDCPSMGNPNLAQQAERHRKALSVPVPEFRAKFVTLSSGELEISVTPTQFSNVINARMGFNPLLDCPRKRRTVEEQTERDAENRQRASKRAKIRVRYLIKTIVADHLLTFNYRENVLDRDRVARDWKECMRLFHQRYPDWCFVAALEKCDSDETGEGHRGTLHIHVAVKGRQDIKWLLRCWLLAIGQPPSEVSDWYVHGVKLGEKSLGAVNVQSPNKRWGGSQKWKSNKLAGYLTKYIGKEFAESVKGKKKYWHSKGIDRPKIERFYLRASTWLEAIHEALEHIKRPGVHNIEVWGDHDAGVVWITGGGAITGGDVLLEIEEIIDSDNPLDSYASEF